MKRKIKIIGAGSIGNHFANAARKLSWDVSIFDIDKNALERTKHKIFPERYGKWDNEIKLLEKNDFGEFDLIIIGTPPDTHLKVLEEEIKYNPKSILIEKPVCTPNKTEIQKIKNIISKSNVTFFCGYDHVLGKASLEIQNLLKKYDFGKPLFIDVEFREHWEGIFKAHDWLDGPKDSYLGFTMRGGGSIGEHSHGINFWQYISNQVGGGKISFISAVLDKIKNPDVNYDQAMSITLKTKNGLNGRIIQDVITKPSKKFARVQFSNGFIEWNCSSNHNLDTVTFSSNNKNPKSIKFPKIRPDDFIQELQHIDMYLKKEKKDINNESDISLKKGLETMDVIYAAIKSDKDKKSIIIK